MGLFTIAKLALPAVDTWADGRELAVGAAVVASVLVAFSLGMRAGRRRPAVVGGAD